MTDTKEQIDALATDTVYDVLVMRCLARRHVYAAHDQRAMRQENELNANAQGWTYGRPALCD